MYADGVTVVGRGVGVGLRLPQAQGRDAGAGDGEIVDLLTALALDHVDVVPADRAEQLTVEGQALLERGDDEVDVAQFRADRGSALGSAGIVRDRQPADLELVDPQPLDPGAADRQAPDRERADGAGPDRE